MRLRAVMLLVCAAAAAGCASRGGEPEDRTRIHRETFDFVVQTLDRHYFDPEYGGLDWPALVAAARARLESVHTDRELHALLNGLLARLGRSHTGIYEAGEEGPRVVSAFGPGGAEPQAEPDAPAGGSGRGRDRAHGTSGLEVHLLGAEAIVVRVKGPAAAAGILAGEKLLRVDAHDLDKELRVPAGAAGGASRALDAAERRIAGWLAGAPGTPVSLVLRRGGAEPRAITLERAVDLTQRIQVFNLPPIPAEFETRRLPGDVAYLRFSIFFMQLLPRIHEALLDARDARGLIIDLRGNPGGIGIMAIPVASLLTRREILLGTMRQRDGELRFPVTPAEVTVDVPLAILVDERTGSTAEILAAGLQECGRAIVVGTPTAGAVLTSLVLDLPTGARLQFPTADFRTGAGVALEGRGVVPDLRAALSPESLLRGRDDVIDAAAARLLGQPLPPEPHHDVR